MSSIEGELNFNETPPPPTATTTKQTASSSNSGNKSLKNVDKSRKEEIEKILNSFLEQQKVHITASVTAAAGKAIDVLSADMLKKMNEANKKFEDFAKWSFKQLNEISELAKDGKTKADSLAAKVNEIKEEVSKINGTSADAESHNNNGQPEQWFFDYNESGSRAPEPRRAYHQQNYRRSYRSRPYYRRSFRHWFFKDAYNTCIAEEMLTKNKIKSKKHIIIKTI